MLAAIAQEDGPLPSVTALVRLAPQPHEERPVVLESGIDALVDRAFDPAWRPLKRVEDADHGQREEDAEPVGDGEALETHPVLDLQFLGGEGSGDARDHEEGDPDAEESLYAKALLLDLTSADLHNHLAIAASLTSSSSRSAVRLQTTRSWSSRRRRSISR